MLTYFNIICPKCKVNRIFKSRKGYNDAIKYNTSCKKCKKSRALIDLTGKQFGRLFVIKRSDNDMNGRIKWLCKCNCGKEIITRGENLKEGLSLSCGCYHKERVSKRPYEWIFKILKRSSRSMGRICELTYEDIVEFTKYNNCHYCGCEIIWQEHQTKESKTAYYIDRKDSNLGYLKENCVVCCSDCNRIKSNRFNYEEMIRLGKIIGEIRKDRNIKS